MVDVSSTVVIVDDDESVRRALRRLLSTAGYEVETFASASELVRRGPLEGPGCLILDVRMPDINGLQLRDSLASLGHSEPVVFITGYGDVETGVGAMKAGAVDFLTKPFGEEALLKAVARAIQLDAEARHESAALAEIRCRYRTLTRREREVCHLVATGRLNKQIATVLGTREKTIKVHRARMMRKMRVTSVAELVRAVDRLARADDGEADDALDHAGEDHAGE
jgi:FixJ family two-component response regulator